MFASIVSGYDFFDRVHKLQAKADQRYDPPSYLHKSHSHFDLRLIILRHSDRVDTTYGDDWYNKIFGNMPSAPRESYRHEALPSRLPLRPLTFHYLLDPPITGFAEKKAIIRGNSLSSMIDHVDFCYSSPASRCVLTANSVLKGMNQQHVRIRLEPYLFEPLSWNDALQHYSSIPPFLSTNDWLRTGYNVDRHYRCIDDYLYLNETENDYFQRSQRVLKSIEHLHHMERMPIDRRQKSHGRTTTVLIVGHAASPVIFPMIASGQPFNSHAFIQGCRNVPFLHTVDLKRDYHSRRWFSQTIDINF
jgi:broad specificity phosphatase PhoE